MKKIDPFETHPSIPPTTSFGEFSFGAFGLARAVREIKLLQLEVSALRNIIRTRLDSSQPNFEEKLNDQVRAEIEKIINEHNS